MDDPKNSPFVMFWMNVGGAIFFTILGVLILIDPQIIPGVRSSLVRYTLAVAVFVGVGGCIVTANEMRKRL